MSSDGISPGASGTTLGAAFAGFTIGTVLFGITITQAYHYFMYSHAPSRSQRISVIIILLLDSLHFAFSIHMLFNYLLQISGDDRVKPWVVWSLKALGSVQVFFVIYVQGLYLYKMWMYSGGESDQLLSTRFKRSLKAFVIFLCILAIGVGVLFLVELQKIEVIYEFTIEFEYVIYVGFGTTALIDMGIAAAMCLMLYKSSEGTTRRSRIIVATLIQYFVGTGLLTSLGALMCMVLYIAKPVSLLYLGVEYSMTRLYAVSVLALYNSQSRLREEFEKPADLENKSMLYFAGPGGIMNGRGTGSSGQGGTSSTQFTTSDEYTHQYRSRYGHRRRTSSLPGSTSHGHGDFADAEEDEARRPLTRGSTRRSREHRQQSRRNTRDRDPNRFIFHEHEATLVQESPLRPVLTPPIRRPARFWTA